MEGSFATDCRLPSETLVSMGGEWMGKAYEEDYIGPPLWDWCRRGAYYVGDVPLRVPRRYWTISRVSNLSHTFGQLPAGWTINFSNLRSNTEWNLSGDSSTAQGPTGDGICRREKAIVGDNQHKMHCEWEKNITEVLTYKS